MLPARDTECYAQNLSNARPFTRALTVTRDVVLGDLGLGEGVKTSFFVKRCTSLQRVLWLHGMDVGGNDVQVPSSRLVLSHPCEITLHVSLFAVLLILTKVLLVYLCLNLNHSKYGLHNIRQSEKMRAGRGRRSPPSESFSNEVCQF